MDKKISETKIVGLAMEILKIERDSGQNTKLRQIDIVKKIKKVIDEEVE